MTTPSNSRPVAHKQKGSQTGGSISYAACSSVISSLQHVPSTGTESHHSPQDEERLRAEPVHRLPGAVNNWLPSAALRDSKLLASQLHVFQPPACRHHEHSNGESSIRHRPQIRQ